MVAERETPAWQCTRTLVPLFRASSATTVVGQQPLQNPKNPSPPPPWVPTLTYKVEGFLEVLLEVLVPRIGGGQLLVGDSRGLGGAASRRLRHTEHARHAQLSQRRDVVGVTGVAQHEEGQHA